MRHEAVGFVDFDAMVLVKPTLAELTGILSDPSKGPLAAMFLVKGDRVKLELLSTSKRWSS